MKLTYISHTLLIFLAICWITAPWANAVSKPASAPSPATPAAPVRQQTWTVTVGDGGPDCFPRPVILVNDTFMPTLEVTEGDLLELTLINNMPEDFPMTPNGLTIHWHGFTMLNNSWYDGTSYVNICPVQPGKSFTYRFIVNEIPGNALNADTLCRPPLDASVWLAHDLSPYPNSSNAV